MPTLTRTGTNPQGGVSLPASKRPLKKRRVTLPKKTAIYAGPELKFKDTASAIDPVTVNGNIVTGSVLLIAGGTGESERVGRRITVKALSMRYVVTLFTQTNPAATDDGVRVIVYHDKQANGANAATTDILENPSGGYLSFNQLSNKSRFNILADRYHDVSATSGAYDGTNFNSGTIAVTDSVHLRLNIPVEYATSGSAITDLKSNNIGIMVISDAGRMRFKANTRVRYTDM